MTGVQTCALPISGELLDGVQGFAPAANQGAQALALQNHLIASLLREIDLDFRGAVHVGQKSGEEGLDGLGLFVVHLFAQVLGLPLRRGGTLLFLLSRGFPPLRALPVFRSGTAGRRLSAPEPASYAVERTLPAAERTLPAEKGPAEWESGSAAGPVERPAGPEKESAERGAGLSPKALSDRWERDSRRYDGGFTLY